MLCPKCCNIHFKRIEDCEAIQQKPEWVKRLREDKIWGGGPRGSVINVHHKSQRDLKSSADRGCHFCAMLWGRLFGKESSSEDNSPVSVTFGDCLSRYFTRGEIILRRDVAERCQTESGMEEWNRYDWIFVHCGKRLATTSNKFEYQGTKKQIKTKD